MKKQRNKNRTTSFIVCSQKEEEEATTRKAKNKSFCGEIKKLLLRLFARKIDKKFSR
jgi:hypothetical protein